MDLAAFGVLAPSFLSLIICVCFLVAFSLLSSNPDDDSDGDDDSNREDFPEIETVAPASRFALVVAGVFGAAVLVVVGDVLEDGVIGFADAEVVLDRALVKKD
jgi:hypothetical protein